VQTHQRLYVQRGRYRHYLGSAAIFDASTNNTSDSSFFVDLKEICAPIRYSDTKKGPDKALWRCAESEEFIRLIEESKTMRFIYAHEKPTDRMVSYYNPQPSIKVKNGIYLRRIRGTYGGNKSDYCGAVTAHVADLTTIKLVVNATVSENKKLAAADVKNFYLMSDLERAEYMRITRAQLPDDIIARYNLEQYFVPSKDGNSVNDFVVVEITKGIYGLPQAGRLAQEKLVKHLTTQGYHQCANAPCLFRHETRDVMFTLVVDDFLIKYGLDEDVEHLFATLRQLYEITTDITASKYVGITIQIDRTARTASLSMPDYVRKALERFNTVLANHVTDSPLRYTAPTYGRGVQQPTEEDTSLPLSRADTKLVQQIVGVFLYYARCVDPTMLTALNKLASVQSKPTERVMADVQRFLQYAATWPVAEIVYHASDMRLCVESDASYLSEPHSRSRAGGFHYLGNNGNSPRSAGSPVNGAIDCMSVIIKSVVSSAFEAEYVALFINAQNAMGLCKTLHDLGYPQHATSIVSDNSCAVGVATKTVTQRRSKCIDMRFNWIQDRVADKTFDVIWQPGKDNLADYFTKNHPVHHFKAMRSTYVRTPHLLALRDNAYGRRHAVRHAAAALRRVAVSKGVLTEPITDSSNYWETASPSQNRALALTKPYSCNVSP
jgi:hypothetical protein